MYSGLSGPVGPAHEERVHEQLKKGAFFHCVLLFTLFLPLLCTDFSVTFSPPFLTSFSRKPFRRGVYKSAQKLTVSGGGWGGVDAFCAWLCHRARPASSHTKVCCGAGRTRFRAIHQKSSHLRREEGQMGAAGRHRPVARRAWVGVQLSKSAAGLQKLREPAQTGRAISSGLFKRTAIGGCDPAKQY